MFKKAILPIFAPLAILVFTSASESQLRWGYAAIAAVLAEKVGRDSKSMAVVVSGGNIDMKSFGGIVSNQ